MRNYEQIANLISQDFDKETIILLTDSTESEVDQIAANVELEMNMQSKGFDRFMVRQEAAKDSGRVMDSEVTMQRVKELLKPMAKAITEYCEESTGPGRPSIIPTELSKHDPMMLSLATIRKVIMAITVDKPELTSLAGNLVEDFTEGLELPERVRVGWKLVSLLCKHCDGHFEIVLKGKGQHAVNCVQATEAFHAWEDLNEKLMAELAVMYRPTVVPPKPWVNLKEGGYWDKNMKQSFIRNNPKANNKTHGPKVIPKVYEAVNKVQATPFTVNNFVLDVANELALDKKLFFSKFFEEIPKRPHDERTANLQATIEACEKTLGITKEVREEKGKGFGQWVKDMLERITDGERYRTKVKLEEARFKMVQYVKWRKEVTSKKSKNRVITTALEVANDYSSYRNIYFPHNLDWRGRMYPMCSGLTTQGVTLQKALIKFGAGKPIGTKEALYWLMVHTANSFGHDKLSWQARLKWAAMNKDLIIRVAEEPIKNLEDWKSTDEPWLFLAACEQMCKYYKDGLDAVVDISIPMDGTCNGAQHYAAMAKDTKGAYGVNVAPNGTQKLSERLKELRENRQCPISPYRPVDMGVNEEMMEVIED